MLAHPPRPRKPCRVTESRHGGNPPQSSGNVRISGYARLSPRRRGVTTTSAPSATRSDEKVNNRARTKGTMEGIRERPRRDPERRERLPGTVPTDHSHHRRTGRSPG